MRIAAFFRMMAENAYIFFPVCYNISATENYGDVDIHKTSNYQLSFLFLVSSKPLFKYEIENI